MEIIIGLAILAGIVWYIYKKVGVAADVNNDGKVNSEDAKVAVDMAVTSVGGFATGAAVAAANAVEKKVEEVAVKVVEEVKAVEANIETAVVEEAKEAAAELVTKVEEVKTEVVEEIKKVAKRGRKSKVK
jgi:hypothetical protein